MLKLRPRIRLVLLITLYSVCSCIALHFFIAHACNNHISLFSLTVTYNWLCQQALQSVKCFVKLVLSVCEAVHALCDTHCVNVTCIWKLFSLIWLKLFFKTVPSSAVKYVKKCNDLCVVPPEHEVRRLQTYCRPCL